MLSLWLLALESVQFTSALTLEKRGVPSVVRAPFGGRPVADVADFHHRRGKRDQTSIIVSQRAAGSYAEVSFGTPPQRLPVRFSTSNDQIYITAAESTDFDPMLERSSRLSYAYNASASTTSRFIKANASIDFETPYSEWYGTEGHVTDTLAIGDLRVDAVEFAIQDQHAGNVIGLEYSAPNSSVTFLPHALVKSNAIKTPALSMCGWTKRWHYPLRLLPSAAAKEFYSMPEIKDPRRWVPCAMKTQNVSLTFRFGQATIKSPLSSFITECTRPEGDIIKCAIDITETTPPLMTVSHLGTNTSRCIQSMIWGMMRFILHTYVQSMH
ncbi:hypothetical protein BDV29DRAFT_178409 [Aspergillus leporis]|uniref:Peptidase A1 domain-containing protein n=1 Tax=Aspergillus leporis TaxID=41062 RepID=A0A5N5WXG7_9EURO|nr:hypothetical protein BDV29DRAFT_178409 [Aspergillus leporis]